MEQLIAIGLVRVNLGWVRWPLARGRIYCIFGGAGLPFWRGDWALGYYYRGDWALDYY